MPEAQSIEAHRSKLKKPLKTRTSCRTCRNGSSIHWYRKPNAGAIQTTSSLPENGVRSRNPLRYLRARSDLQSRHWRRPPCQDRYDLTAPGCPVASEIARSIEAVVGAVPGVLGVTVAVVFDPPWTRDACRMKRGFARQFLSFAEQLARVRLSAAQ